MKMIATLIAATLIIAPGAAFAQDTGDARFKGGFVGIEVGRDSHEVRQPGAPTTRDGVDRKGINGRVFAGYDLNLGGVAVLGVEAGIGKGGRTVRQNSLVAPGRYAVDPGLGYDATGRIGFTPTSSVLVYGRGGYRWLRTQRIISGQATGNGTSKLTEKGWTYGGGAEFALGQNFSIRAEYDRTSYSKDFKSSKIAVGAAIRF